MVDKPYCIWIKEWKERKKFILEHINFNNISYFSERGYKGHLVYRLNKLEQTCEVIPIEIKDKYKGFYKDIHVIKYSSFMQNRIIPGLKITTEKLFNYYKEKYNGNRQEE